MALERDFLGRVGQHLAAGGFQAPPGLRIARGRQAAPGPEREGVAAERLEFVLSRQMCDAKKRRRAEFVVATGLGRGFSLRAIGKIVKVARRWRGAKWPPRGFQPRARPPGWNRGRRRS